MIVSVSLRQLQYCLSRMPRHIFAEHLDSIQAVQSSCDVQHTLGLCDHTRRMSTYLDFWSNHNTSYASYFTMSSTYDHRTWGTSSPIRSVIFSDDIARYGNWYPRIRFHVLDHCALRSISYVQEPQHTRPEDRSWLTH